MSSRSPAPVPEADLFDASPRGATTPRTVLIWQRLMGGSAAAQVLATFF